MSVATSAPSVDDLMPDAIALASREGSVPSKDRLMRELRIGRPKAIEIYDRLVEEAAKRRSRRARRLAELNRKGSVRRVVDARLVTPSDTPVSPGVGPVDPWSYAKPVSRPEGPPPARPEGALPSASVGLPKPRRAVASWPLLLLALPAFVAIWSGWVDLGRLTGFGVVRPLPGIADGFRLNTAITLPIGLEAYGAYASFVWLTAAVSAQARSFARWSAIGSLVLGALGQVAYHLMIAAGWTHAPWPITAAVSCVPVAVFGLGLALRHLTKEEG